MEGVDDLLDGGIPLPEVEVEGIDIVGLEVLQRRVDRVTEGLGAVARVGGASDGIGGEVEVVGVLKGVGMSVRRIEEGYMTKETNLGSNNDLVTNTSLLSPFADELFRGPILAAEKTRVSDKNLCS